MGYAGFNIAREDIKHTISDVSDVGVKSFLLPLVRKGKRQDLTPPYLASRYFTIAYSQFSPSNTPFQEIGNKEVIDG